MQKITKLGYDFYYIPKNTLMYRGNNLQYFDIVGLNPYYEYFTDSLQIANVYGLVKLYSLKKDIFLYSLDVQSNIDNLKQIADINTRKAISESYVCTQGKILRNSKYDNDEKIVKLICSIGLNGYANERMLVSQGNFFHQEITICDPDKYVEFVEKNPYSHDIIDNEYQKLISGDNIITYLKTKCTKAIQYRNEKTIYSDVYDKYPDFRNTIFNSLGILIDDVYKIIYEDNLGNNVSIIDLTTLEKEQLIDLLSDRFHKNLSTDDIAKTLYSYIYYRTYDTKDITDDDIDSIIQTVTNYRIKLNTQLYEKLTNDKFI